MPTYFNPDPSIDLRWAANTIRDKADQMQKAIESAGSLVEPCRKALAPEIQKDIQAWDEIKASLDVAVVKAREAAAIVDKTAAAFEHVFGPEETY